MGPQKLPGTPSSYLDIDPGADAEQSHGFQRIDVGGDVYIRYSRYCRINPNDSQINRGAYLAVGFLAKALTLHAAANCIDLVSQIFGQLKGFIGPDKRVRKDFHLKHYTYDGNGLQDAIDSNCSPLLLADVLTQGLNGEGALSWDKPISLESAQLGRTGDLARYLVYFGTGAPAAALRFDRDREKIRTLTEKLAVAASYADQAQEEWLSYQSMIQKHLPSVLERGTELRDLVDEVERLSDSLDSARATRPATVVPQASSGGLGLEVARQSPVARDQFSQRHTYLQGTRTGPRPRLKSSDPRASGRAHRTERWELPIRLSTREVAFIAGAVIAFALVATLAIVYFARGGSEVTAGSIGQPRSNQVDETRSSDIGLRREREPLGESTRD